MSRVFVCGEVKEAWQWLDLRSFKSSTLPSILESELGTGRPLAALRVLMYLFVAEMVVMSSFGRWGLVGIGEGGCEGGCEEEDGGGGERRTKGSE